MRGYAGSSDFQTGIGCPSSGSGDRPVAGLGQPLAELAVPDVLGHPGDLLVQLHHPVAERRDLHEPRVHRPVDQRVAAAPAVRVRVNKLRAQYPQCYQAVLEASNQRPPMTLRVNRRKTSVAEYQKRLIKMVWTHSDYGTMRSS